MHFPAMDERGGTEQEADGECQKSLSVDCESIVEYNFPGASCLIKLSN